MKTAEHKEKTSRADQKGLRRVHEAVHWLAILNHPHDDETARAFEEWARQSPRHLGTFLKQNAINDLFNLPENYPPEEELKAFAAEACASARWRRTRRRLALLLFLIVVWAMVVLVSLSDTLSVFP